MQFINSDNGSNIKKALLDMEKMEMTVEEEPLLLVDEDEDDWTNNAAASSNAAAMTEDSITFGPCPVPVEDEFHPVALDEEVPPLVRLIGHPQRCCASRPGAWGDR